MKSLLYYCFYFYNDFYPSFELHLMVVVGIVIVIVIEKRKNLSFVFYMLVFIVKEWDKVSFTFNYWF